jgi:hypothetical protein
MKINFRWPWSKKAPPPDNQAIPEPPEIPAPPKTTWRFLGHSIRGTQHFAKSLPNQDALESWVADDELLPRIVAVADGHGSAKSFRSDVGSRLAVEIAIASARELVQSAADQPSAFKQAFEAELPVELVRRWKTAIEKHLTENPFSVDEVEKVATEQGAAARRQVEESPELAYGATLLLILVTEDFIACLQLGDGDIVILAPDSQVSQPIEPDARHIANETTSLCSAEAWRNVRTHFQTLAGKPPLLLFAATDGYANAFRSAEGFLAVAQDLADILASDGEEAVRAALPGWLEDASREGSGDDVTLGILWRPEALLKVEALAQTENAPTSPSLD